MAPPTDPQTRRRPGWQLPMLVIATPIALVVSVWAFRSRTTTTEGPASLDARVAVALDDAPDPAPIPSDAGLAPMPAPFHERTCCAFGMDLRTQLANLDVPFFEIGNVIGPDALGHHVYDLTDDAPVTEGNGLIYTCRGGWIDTAHVRENADYTFYFGRRIAATIETGTTITLTGADADTEIVIAPVSHDEVARLGALPIAGTIARYVVFRIALWHEVATWYGYETVQGFSEQLSAFSIEDLYSDVLGARLGGAALDDTRLVDTDDYEQAMEAMLQATLARLDARSQSEAESIMRALDGRWWSSARRLPDVRLVMRRAFPPAIDVIAPWRAEDAFGPGSVPAAVRDACTGSHPRPLALAWRIGDLDVHTLVDITWRPGRWGDGALPYRDPVEHVLLDRDLDALVAETHARMETVLGHGFDAPRGD